MIQWSITMAFMYLSTVTYLGTLQFITPISREANLEFLIVPLSKVLLLLLFCYKYCMYI
jgi:hypothetical protein